MLAAIPGPDFCKLVMVLLESTLAAIPGPDFCKLVMVLLESMLAAMPGPDFCKLVMVLLEIGALEVACEDESRTSDDRIPGDQWRL